MCTVTLMHSPSSESLHNITHIQGKTIPWMSVDSIHACNHLTVSPIPLGEVEIWG